VRAEHRSLSTGGTAPAYYSRMCNKNIIALCLFVAPFACSEDAPTRPDDGTVQAWDECIWDGQYVRSLCEADLACAWNGICVPRCEGLSECMFEGFESKCELDDGENVCKVRCNEDRECPQTGGAQLHCLDSFCVREP